MSHQSPASPPAPPQRVKMTVEMSADLNRTLDQLVATLGTTKSDIVRKALALLEVAAEAKQKDQILGLVNKSDGKLVTRIVGL